MEDIASSRFSSHERQQNDDSPSKKRETTSGQCDTKRITHKRARINDTKELVEHLVIVGNYHRHQNWRRQEYERFVAREEPAKKSEIEGQDNEQQEDEDEEARGEIEHSKGRSIYLSTADILDYGCPVSNHRSDSNCFWPGLKIAPPFMPEKIWEDMWGDGVPPVGFSDQRLSEAAHELFDEKSNEPRKDLLHPQNVTKHPTKSESTRSLLLRCWHRAIHAVSQSTALDPHDLIKENSVCNKSEDQIGPFSSSTKNDSANARDLPVETGRNFDDPFTETMDTLPSQLEEHGESSQTKENSDESDASESEHLPSSQSSVCTDMEKSQPSSPQDALPEEERPPIVVFPSGDGVYSEQNARLQCGKLGIGLPKFLADDIAFCCPVCRADLGSRVRLENHFFGEQHVRGCAWRTIECQRRVLLDEALRAEVLVQARQLVQLVAVRSVDKIKELRTHVQQDSSLPNVAEPFRPAFDWRHIEQIFGSFADAAQPKDPTADYVEDVFTTVDAHLSLNSPVAPRSITLPPLLLNRFILEAVRHRIHERYTRVAK